MENNSNNSNTINNLKTNTIMKNENQLNELFKQFCKINGISTKENNHLIKSKTSKSKCLFSIEKEIEILNNRNDLKLVEFKKGDTFIDKKGNESTYKNDRIENRFYKNPIGNEVYFNLKYKGMIIPFGSESINKSLVCKNDVSELINQLTNFKNIIETLDENHSLFQWDGFLSKKQLDIKNNK